MAHFPFSEDNFFSECLKSIIINGLLKRRKIGKKKKKEKSELETSFSAS